jgi:hypothetical protein
MVEVIRKWLIQLRNNFYINDARMNTLLFSDEKVIIADNENDLQKDVYKFNEITKQYNI